MKVGTKRTARQSGWLRLPWCWWWLFVVRIVYQHLLFYAIIWKTKPNFVYSIQKHLFMTCLFCPNLLRTYNVLAMYLIIIIIIIIKVSYLIAQAQCLTNWGDWFIHGHVLIRVLYTKLMYKSESKNCCVNKSLILIVQTCTFRFLTLWFVHFHPEDSAQ